MFNRVVNAKIYTFSYFCTMIKIFTEVEIPDYSRKLSLEDKVMVLGREGCAEAVRAGFNQGAGP